MVNTRSTVRSPALNILLLSLLGLGGLVYALVGFFAQDFLWFWPIFNQQPSEIIIHCHGQDVSLEPDSPYFLPLTYVVNQQLSAEKRVDDDSISLEAYRELQQNQATISVEMRFDHQPIRIHSYRSYFSGVDALLIVLSGDEQNWATIYGAHQNQPTPGIIRLINGQAIADYLVQQHLCAAPCKEW
jgi:hypothetical protein